MRIEFGGAKLANGGGNLNSLLIAGAGNKTVIENVMVVFLVETQLKYMGDLNMSQMVSLNRVMTITDLILEHNVELLIL
jgi:hypothetical protein